MKVMTRIYRESLRHKECSFIFYPNAMRREASLDYDETSDHGSEDATVMVKPDNSGECFALVVSDLAYHPDSQVTAFEKSDVLELQHWIESEMQEAIPNPILPYCQIPEAVRDRI
jgi:hypothetical protein